MTKPLSNAAQTILDASMEHSGPAFEPVVRRIAAAALRAAVEQCVSNGFGNKWMTTAHVLSIAKELER